MLWVNLVDRIKSVSPGVLKLGSASWRFERCFHLLLKGTEVDGTLVVTFWRTAGSITMTLPRWVVGDPLKLTTSPKPECVVMQPMPLIHMWWFWRCKWRCCALAMVVEPLGAFTRTWLFRWLWHVQHDVVGCTCWPRSWDACLFLRIGFYIEMKPSVVGHFWHLWMEGHCFKMWPSFRQFRQNPLSGFYAEGWCPGILPLPQLESLPPRILS